MLDHFRWHQPFGILLEFAFCFIITLSIVRGWSCRDAIKLKKSEKKQITNSIEISDVGHKVVLSNFNPPKNL